MYSSMVTYLKVYMDLSLCYNGKGEGLVWKLHKSIYELRQASRQWFYKFSISLTTKGFDQSKSNYSLFTYGLGSPLVIFLVYIDDIILATPSLAIIHQV